MNLTISEILALPEQLGYPKHSWFWVPEDCAESEQLSPQGYQRRAYKTTLDVCHGPYTGGQRSILVAHVSPLLVTARKHSQSKPLSSLVLKAYNPQTQEVYGSHTMPLPQNLDESLATKVLELYIAAETHVEENLRQNRP